MYELWLKYTMWNKFLSSTNINPFHITNTKLKKDPFSYTHLYLLTKLQAELMSICISRTYQRIKVHLIVVKWFCKSFRNVDRHIVLGNNQNLTLFLILLIMIRPRYITLSRS